MKSFAGILTSAFAIGLASALLATASVNAQTTQPMSEIDKLVQDIAAHKAACSAKDANATICANEETSLADRQKRLGVDNDALNAKLKTRGGWRWP